MAKIACSPKAPWVYGLLITCSGLGLTLAQEIMANPCAPHGSLVLMIPTADGLVLMADKQTKDPMRGVLESSDKIEQAGNYTAVASVGVPQYCGFIGNFVIPNPEFDANRVVKNYFLGHGEPESIYESANVQAEYMRQQFAKYILSIPQNKRPSSGADGGDFTLFMTTIVHYNRATKEYQQIVLKLHYQNVYPNPSIWVSGHIEGHDLFAKCFANAYGKNEVVEELRSGSNSSFDRMRKSKYANLLLQQLPARHKVTAKEAIASAAHLMEDTSQHLHLVDNSGIPVGEIVDVALLGPGGFKWLYQRTRCSQLY